jgi:hypothetical protein
MEPNGLIQANMTNIGKRELTFAKGAEQSFLQATPSLTRAADGLVFTKASTKPKSKKYSIVRMA